MRKFFSAGKPKYCRACSFAGKKRKEGSFMKKVLLVVALLLLTVPAMAATTITVYNEGNYNLPDGNKATILRVGYVSDVDIRALALDLHVDPNCNFQNIRDFNVGENSSTVKGYGIFPSRFRDFINPSTPVWTDANYNPSTAWNEPGTIDPRTGLGFSTMTVEMGTLFSGDANKPALSGTLFRVDVNSYGVAGTYNVTVAANALRGGIVGADANAIAGVVFNGTQVVIPSACTFTVPNIVGMTRANALAALGSNNCTLGTEVNGFGGATAVGSVYAQSPAAGTTACPGPVAVNMSTAMYPIKTMTVANSLYMNWVTMGKPACWAYPRQCHGDADGKKLGNFWTSSNDLTILKSGVNKLQSALPTGSICASFTHKKLGNFWVSSNDLTVLKTYVNKLESLVPVCGTPGVADANYWYFCVPTGATCPAGVTCATVGVCPNTP